MTILRIGRFGRDVAQTNVARASFKTGGLDLSGRISSDRRAEADVARNQLLGMVANPDEPVVPVTVQEAPEWDGWYRVTDASVDVDPGGLSLGHWSYQVSLELAARSPMWTSMVEGVLRSNAHGITTGIPWHAVPGHAQHYSWYPTAAGGTNQTRACEGGSVQWREADLYDGIARWSVPLPWAYEGAATVECFTDGRWWTWTGRGTPPGPVRIGNGLVRASMCPSWQSTPGRLDCSWWKPATAQWTTPKPFRLYHTIGTYIYTDWDRCDIVANSPALVVIRFSSIPPSGGTSILTVTLRRGSRTIYGHFATDHTELVAVGPSSEASTVGVLGGIEAAANDADGLRFQVFAPVAFTANHYLGQLGATTSYRWPFAVGARFGTDTGLFGADSQVRQYMASTAERPMASRMTV